METRLFSEKSAFDGMIADKDFSKCLELGSVSKEDQENRQAVYAQVMEQYEEMKDYYTKNFSGYTEIPILSNQYFNASMASYVRSFAGQLTVERSMDHPTSLLWYDDLLGVVDNRVVLPNLGAENLNNINARFQAKANLVEGQVEYSISTNKKLIPGSVKVQLVHAIDPTKVYTMQDSNRDGQLLAPAGILAAQTGVNINYATGLVTFKIGDGFQIAANDSYTIMGYEDVAGDPAFGQLTGPGNNRFKIDMKNIQVTAEPDMLIGESNLMAIAAAKKSVGFNPQERIGQKLTELYTKLINGKLTDRIIGGFSGDVKTIPMRQYQAHFVDYNSRLDAFQGDLVEIDTMLARKTTKAVKATAYLVSTEMGDWFRRLRSTGAWTDNKESTYINDLLGYYNGIPVLRHNSVESNAGYAVHKTPGGEIAPLMRGIYLPLTNSPIVGNYNNPTQYAQGVYYQEANELIFPELIQKFTIDAAEGAFPVQINQ